MMLNDISPVPDSHHSDRSSTGAADQTEIKNVTKFNVAPEFLTDEDFDFNGTSRKEYENAYYKKICSEIIDDFLYLGSDIVAKDYEIF